MLTFLSVADSFILTKWHCPLGWLFFCADRTRTGGSISEAPRSKPKARLIGEAELMQGSEASRRPSHRHHKRTVILIELRFFSFCHFRQKISAITLFLGTPEHFLIISIKLGRYGSFSAAAFLHLLCFLFSGCTLNRWITGCNRWTTGIIVELLEKSLNYRGNR